MAENLNYGYDETKNVETESVKCDSCGASMVFDPKTQMLFCPHCHTKVDFDKSKIAEEVDLKNGFKNAKQWSKDEAVVFRCEACGAKVVLQAQETAKNCPFCGTAAVKKTDELAGIKPNAVVPFLFDIEKAIGYCKAWAKKKLFAPTKFKNNLNPDNVHGVYTPCFTFDSNTQSTYVGRLGETHTRVVGSGKNQHTETYIVWQNVSGTYGQFFNDVLTAAGPKIDQKTIDNLAPYNTDKAGEYKESYLLGFMAYHYERELPECWGTAKSKIDAQIRRNILARYHYDVIDYFNVSTSHSAVTYKYVMLPVYVGNYTFKSKVYNFFVNGSTSKVTGKTPLSPLKVGIAVVLGLAVLAGIGFLIYYLYSIGVFD